MRNILAYPITLEEVTNELLAVEAEFDAKQCIGGMRGILVEKARQFIEQNSEAFAQYLVDNPL